MNIDWPTSKGDPIYPVWRYKDQKGLYEADALRKFAHDLVDHIKELELPVREAMKQARGDGLDPIAYANMMHKRVAGLERENERLREDVARYENGRLVMTGEIKQLKGEIANEISHRDALWAERDQLRDNLAHVVGTASNVEPDGWIRYPRHVAGGPEPEEVIMYEFASRDEPHEGEGWVPLYSRPAVEPTAAALITAFKAGAAWLGNGGDMLDVDDNARQYAHSAAIDQTPVEAAAASPPAELCPEPYCCQTKGHEEGAMTCRSDSSLASNSPSMLPCPFCGYAVDETDVNGSGEKDGKDADCVCCPECLNMGPMAFGKDGAVAAWNKRHAHEPPARRSGCPDLDPNWPDASGKPRGPRLCVLYPSCTCGEEDKRIADARRPQPPPAALPPLNADLIEILGRPNFACAQIARVLRLTGMEITQRAEAEQAAVLHWMLGLYLKHDDEWRAKGDAILAEARAASPAPAAPHDLGRWKCKHGSEHAGAIAVALCGCERPGAQP